MMFIAQPVRSLGRGAIRLFSAVGRAGYLAGDAVRALRKGSLWAPHLIGQMARIGVGSIPIALFIATFTGVVLALQASDILTGAVPLYFVGTFVGKTMVLELGPVLTGLALSGRVGAAIAAELGTMRVTEQIDALEVMGINSLNYLVFPKIVAMLFYPFVIAIAMFLGILGGYTAAVLGGFATGDQFIQGLQEDFVPFQLVYAFIKTFVFAILLATIPSYFGYYMKGGALEVGKASTTSFVWTSVFIILSNYLITQLLLS